MEPGGFFFLIGNLLMTTRLDVVNACLAIMGEAPLNALTEDHAFKEGALRILDRNDDDIQSRGWWYNLENLLLRVNPQDNRVYMPTDIGTVRPEGHWGARYVQRGRVLYDLHEGTDRFPSTFQLRVKFIRKIPIQDCPQSVGAYIARKTVMDFQQEFDGDQTKTRNLMIEVFGNGGNILGLKGAAEAEHVRNIGYNFVIENERLSRVTNRINYSRRPR